MKFVSIVLASLFFLRTSSYSQTRLSVQIITSGTNTSIRGMSVPTENIIWVSGSNGTIGKSIDSGKTWRWITVGGYEKRDFRDIEAFDSSNAIIMAVGNPAYILKTTDGGTSWKKVFEKEMNGMFLDAMDFKNNSEGICIGDPITAGHQGENFYYLIRTFDGGDTWTEVAPSQVAKAEEGAAIFAASGTNISFLNHPDFEYAFVTGGLSSHLVLIGRKGKPNKKIHIPMVQGKESSGTFSMATNKQKKFYCTGGNYKAPEDPSNNFYFTTNAGGRWLSPKISSPSGYRSCIQIIKNKTAVACGTNGVDFAQNAHKRWQKVSAESFNVCIVSKAGKVFLAGEKGKIGRLIF